MSSLTYKQAQPFYYDNFIDPYIPELWSQEGLAILEENMVITNLVHRDFSNQLASYGDTINTRKPKMLGS